MRDCSRNPPGQRQTQQQGYLEKEEAGATTAKMNPVYEHGQKAGVSAEIATEFELPQLQASEARDHPEHCRGRRSRLAIKSIPRTKRGKVLLERLALDRVFCLWSQGLD